MQSEPTQPPFPVLPETLGLIQLTRSALPRGPAGHELGGHLLFDILISKVADHDELGDILDAFQSYILTDEWPAELGTVADLVKLLHDTTD